MNNPELNDELCPVCGFHDPQGHFVETGKNTANQEMSCDNCEAEWSNIYKLDQQFISSVGEVGHD